MRGLFPIFLLLAGGVAAWLYLAPTTVPAAPPTTPTSNGTSPDGPAPDKAAPLKGTATPRPEGPVASGTQPPRAVQHSSGPGGRTPEVPIPVGGTKEEISNALYERTMNLELAPEERLKRVDDYIAHAKGFLPKEEVARRVVELATPAHEVAPDGSFRGGVLARLKGLKSEALVSTLTENLTSDLPKVRLGAITALSDYQTDGAVRDRVRELMREEQDSSVREKAQAILSSDPGAQGQGDPTKNKR